MWITALGERVLRGAEWELVRIGISTLWDDIESQEDDEEAGATGVKAFDRLPRPGRLALLAEIARGLHVAGVPCRDLTALNEAAIAAVFAQIRYLVEVEVDAQLWGFDTFTDDPTGRPREMVLAAARKARQGSLPDAGSTEISAWYDLIRSQLFRILDDIDYLAADFFLDTARPQSRLMKESPGIDEGYYSASPQAPIGRDLEAVRVDLGRICGRPDAWTTPQ